MTPPLIGIRGLRKSYQAGLQGCTATARALDGVHLQVNRGEVVAIVGGPSSGKTTLLLCASGLLAPDGGTIERVSDTSGCQTRVVYFRDPVHVRVSDDSDPWDLAVIDNIDRVCGDVARAFALLSAIRRAHAHGVGLLLATRELTAVQRIASRILILEQGRLVSAVQTHAPGLAARVAERRSVDRDSGRA
jgi:ABC-type multidrug transport system ATPase subunit